MFALGVDLASQPAKTAAAMLEWRDDGVLIAEVRSPCDDDAILELAEAADVVGIDAPFGWPIPFREVLAAEATHPRWNDAYRDELSYRRTDFAVRARFGRWPLSVSTDRIGLPALRCQGILARLGVTDRSGDGRVYETYPALALHLWGMTSTGYKKREQGAVREAIWRSLGQEAAWLRCRDDAQLEGILASADELDAVVAALAAGAAKRGLVEAVDAAGAEAAVSEGWIVIPREDALSRLWP